MNGGTTSIQIENIHEPITEHKFLGPFRKILIVTGLDGTSVALFQSNPTYFRRALITRILAIIVIILVFFRCGMIFQAADKSHVMSFQWAESNMFAFSGIHTIFCAFCVYGWTKNEFIPKHLKRLETVRILRLKPKTSLDEYSRTHKKAFVWAAMWFLCIMAHSIASAIAQRVILGGNKVTPLLYAVMPFITFLVCFIVTTCVILYVLVNISMSREIKYFNEELEEAMSKKELNFKELMLKFDHRQVELIGLVREANESLGSYAASAPFFLFYGLVNAIYLTSFSDVLPTIAFIIILINLFAIIAIIFFTLRPPSSVQSQIEDTSRILMSHEGFDKDPELFEIYHIINDRSLKTNTRIRVMGAIPICQSSQNFAFLVVPSLGSVLGLIRKVMLANGVPV